MVDYVLAGLVKRRAELVKEARAADVALRRVLADIHRSQRETLTRSARSQ